MPFSRKGVPSARTSSRPSTRTNGKAAPGESPAGAHEARELGGQAAGDRVAGALDADRAKVDGEHVERRLGAALDDAGQTARERIGAERLHGLDDQAARAAARERAYQG